MSKVANILGKIPMSLLTTIWILGYFGFISSAVFLTIVVTLVVLYDEKTTGAESFLAWVFFVLFIWIPYVSYYTCIRQ